MIDKSVLPTIPGSTAGSIFYVIGDRDELQCGIRVFVDTGETNFGNIQPHEQTVIGFRLRITPKEGSQVEFLDLKKYVEPMFPNQMWNGYSKRHVSISGALKFNCRYTEKDALVAFLKEQHSMLEMCKGICDRYSWFEFAFTPEDLEAFLIEETRVALEAVQPPPLPLFEGVSAVVIKFGDYSNQPQEANPHHNEAALAAIGLGGGDATGKTAGTSPVNPPVPNLSAGPLPGSTEKPKALKLKTKAKTALKASKAVQPAIDTPTTPSTK